MALSAVWIAIVVTGSVLLLGLIVLGGIYLWRWHEKGRVAVAADGTIVKLHPSDKDVYWPPRPDGKCGGLKRVSCSTKTLDALHAGKGFLVCTDDIPGTECHAERCQQGYVIDPKNPDKCVEESY